MNSEFIHMRLLVAVLLISLVLCPVFGQTYTISTFAGGGLPVNIPGTSASLYRPNSVAVDAAGNLFIAEQNSVVLRLDATTGVLTLVAGNGTPGNSGDNGPAIGAQLTYPTGLALDAAGNLYIADRGGHCIRKVSRGVITTVAGNGTAAGFSGDNGPATGAQLGSPQNVAVDAAGNLYIATPMTFASAKCQAASSRPWRGTGRGGSAATTVRQPALSWTAPTVSP